MTYNVAGLPEGLSAVHPIDNLPQIGALLNGYDVVLVQEDFAYPDLLRQNLKLRYGSAPFVRGERMHLGDGLSQFANLEFTEPVRTAWSTCNGVVDSFFDCLTPKGFSRSVLRLATGANIHVYNVHLDAGWSAKDKAARALQLKQLTENIATESSGYAVLLAGDFNLTSGERAALGALEAKLGLRDVCTALRCREPGRIDRVLLRSSSEVELSPLRWSVDPSFRDAAGRQLSDHLAVAVELRWQARAVSALPSSAVPSSAPASARHAASSKPGQGVQLRQ